MTRLLKVQQRCRETRLSTSYVLETTRSYEMRVIGYQTVASRFVSGLKQGVEKLLSEGWELYEAPYIFEEEHCQAMILKEAYYKER